MIRETRIKATGRYSSKGLPLFETFLNGKSQGESHEVMIREEELTGMQIYEQVTKDAKFGLRKFVEIR